MMYKLPFEWPTKMHFSQPCHNIPGFHTRDDVQGVYFAFCIYTILSVQGLRDTHISIYIVCCLVRQPLGSKLFDKKFVNIVIVNHSLE